MPKILFSPSLQFRPRFIAEPDPSLLSITKNQKKEKEKEKRERWGRSSTAKIACTSRKRSGPRNGAVPNPKTHPYHTKSFRSTAARTPFSSSSKTLISLRLLSPISSFSNPHRCLCFNYRLTFTPFEYPVCTIDGSVFDVMCVSVLFTITCISSKNLRVLGMMLYLAILDFYGAVWMHWNHHRIGYYLW